MNWEILSREAKRAISIARKEAFASKRRLLFPEHLVLGLIKADESIDKMFQELSIDTHVLETIFSQIVIEKEKLMTSFSSLEKEPTDIILSEPVKDILEKAAIRSQNEFLGQIDTALLLHVLFSQPESSMVTIMEEMGCSLSVFLEKLSLHQASLPLSVFEQSDTVLSNASIFPDSTPLESASDESFPIIDLTALAQESKLDIVVGREKEIEKVLQILARKKKNNPIIIGDPGVGKTSIVEALAQRIACQKVPGMFRDQRILLLDLCSVVSGTKFRGDIEQKLQKLFTWMEHQGNILLFIDEIQQLLGHGFMENSHNLMGLFRSFLNRYEIRIIGTCDAQNYRKSMEKEALFLRRFQPLFIEEPSPQETISILEGIKPSFEKHHLVHISSDAVEAAVTLSSCYFSGRCQPDQAIDLLDETCSHYCYTHQIPPDRLMEAKNSLLTLQKTCCLKEETLSTKSLIIQKQKEYQEKMKDWMKEANQYLVSADDVAKVVSQSTGIPMGKLLESEKHKLINIERELQQKILGQDAAIHSLANALRRSRIGMRDEHKPTGVFLFLGPTGVGKTETAQVLAEYLFGERSSLLRFDMSEYMEKHAISRLIGAPPGYVGYEEGGQLTEAIKRKPYSILLFDEIEKAHPDVFHIWLQLFDDGRLTDSKGFTVDCSNCIVVLTSNIVSHIEDGVATVGFIKETIQQENASLGDHFSSGVLSKLSRIFRPELINRLDEVIVFNTLSHQNLLGIIELLLHKMQQEINPYGIRLEVTKAAKNQLVLEGYSQEFGARPLRRVIQKRIADKLSSAFIENQVKNNESYQIDFCDSRYCYSCLKP